MIQRAIDVQAKIAFRFNGYNRDRNPVAVHEGKDIVSPYYCVAYGGRYYLLVHLSMWYVGIEIGA